MTSPFLRSVCFSVGVSLVLAGLLVNRAFAACSDNGCKASAKCTGDCNGLGSNGKKCICNGQPGRCYCAD